MKKLAIGPVLVCLAASLCAQTAPRIRETGENFTYVAIECLGPYAQMPQKIGELMAEVQKQKLEMVDGPEVLYYNSPGQVKPEELRWDVCVPVDARENAAAPLKKGEYKYATVAETVYKGPYDSVAAAYPALMQFIAANGYVVCGPICESYMDDPNQTKAADCRTLIVVPVQK